MSSSVYFRNARTSRRHQPLKSWVEILIPISLRFLLLKWQSYGLCTLALGSLPCVFGSMPSMLRPMISPKTWQISYLVYLSSLENWKILGIPTRSPSLAARNLAARSPRKLVPRYFVCEDLFRIRQTYRDRHGRHPQCWLGSAAPSAPF